MSNLSDRIDRTLISIRDQLDFKHFKGEYFEMYHYTILKSVFSVYTFLGHNETEPVCFDYLANGSQKYFSTIESSLKKVVPSVTFHLNCIKKLFADKNSFEAPSNVPEDIINALASCYYLLAIAVIDKQYKKVAIDNENIIYLPIEQECTLEYFIGKYVDKASHNSNVESKGEFYRAIQETKNGDKISDAEFGESYNDLYSHGKLTSDRKAKLLGLHQLLGDTGPLNEIVLMLLELENNGIRLQKLVEAPSSESMPFLGYSAIKSQCARVSSLILNHLPISSVYKLTTNVFESYFEAKEIMRILSEFTEAIYFGGKTSGMEKYLEILSRNSSGINRDSLPSLLNSCENYVQEPADQYEMLYYSTLLFKLASFIKQKASILRYIINNKEAFSCDLSNSLLAFNYLHRQVFFRESNNTMKELFDFEQTHLDISPKKWEELKSTVYKVYCNLWGKAEKVSFIDHIACCKIVNTIGKKPSPFAKFTGLHFYGRRDRSGVFYDQYGRESQNSQTLSSMIKHDKFTTEDCMLIEMLIDTQKYCFFGIDIFAVYQQIMNVLDVLEYALISDEPGFAKSPYMHLKACEAVLNEWGKIIPELVVFFRNTLNIPVSGTEELKKLNFFKKTGQENR